jgi:hypothetical protein
MWWINSDNVVQINGLTDVRTSDYVNNATITGQLKDLAASQVPVSLTRITNVTTVVTTTAHGWSTGDKVIVAGVTPSSFNVSEVAITKIDATSFTYVNTAANAAATVVGTIVRTCIGAVVTFVYLTDSDGDYSGKLPYTITVGLVAGNNYTFEVTVAVVGDGEQVFLTIYDNATYQAV